MPYLGEKICLRVLIENENGREEKEAFLPMEEGEYTSFFGQSFEAHVLIEAIEEEAVTLEFLAIHPSSTQYDGKVQRLHREERFQCSFSHTASEGTVETIFFLAVYQRKRKEIPCPNC